MGNYLETIYFRNEQGEDNYPQQLCDHLVERWLGGANAVRGKKLLELFLQLKHIPLYPLYLEFQIIIAF